MYVKFAHGSEAKAGVPDQVVTPNETREALKEMIRDIIRKSWNSTLLIEGRERFTRRRAIKALWAVGGGTIRRFRPENGSHHRSHLRRDVAGPHRHGRVLVVDRIGRSTGTRVHGAFPPRPATKKIKIKKLVCPSTLVCSNGYLLPWPWHRIVS